MPDKVLDFGIARLSTEGIFAVLFVCFLVAVLAGIVFVAIWATGLITSSFRELIQTLSSINANLAALSAKGQELDALSKIVYQTADAIARLEKLNEKMYEMISAMGIRLKP
jgi:sensor histidine kinase YesM